MTLKHVLNLSVSLIFTAGVALGQQPTPPTAPTPPAEPFGTFSMMLDGSGFLGVYTEEITKDNLSQYALHDVRGVGVTEVVKDSPAEKAGLRKGDVITRFDGETVNSVRKLNRLVSEVAPDHRVTLGISRAGGDQEVAVTIGKRQGTYSDTMGTMTIPPDTFPRIETWPNIENVPDGPKFYFGNGRRIGVSTTTLTKQLADFFGIADGKGVLITSVTENSPAAKASLRAGDVITAVNGEKIEDAGDLSRSISKQKEGEVTLTVVRDKNQRTVKVTPEKSDNQILRTGRTANNKVFRDQIRTAIRDGARQGRIVIPQITFPSIPAVDVSMPQIDLRMIPQIKVMMPRVRIVRSSRQPI